MNLYKKETHRATATLRFVERSEMIYVDADVGVGRTIRVLQQLWQPVEGNNDGQWEWRDVPLVTE